MKKTSIFVIQALFLLSLTSLAWADAGQLKLLRKVYPNLKPQCIYCHQDKSPKKEDGKHELNDYGKKVKEISAASATPTEEAYKQAGNPEDFVREKK